MVFLSFIAMFFLHFQHRDLGGMVEGCGVGDGGPGAGLGVTGEISRHRDEAGDPQVAICAQSFQGVHVFLTAYIKGVINVDQPTAVVDQRAHLVDQPGAVPVQVQGAFRGAREKWRVHQHAIEVLLPALHLADLCPEIPTDKIKTVDDLNKVWKDVQAKKSKAILIDVRTHPEFDAGHIEGSNLVTLAHVYTMPRRFTDANAEYWIFCRTANRTVYFGWLMNKYGYKNVNVVKGGIVEWLKKGYPLTNRFMGRFKVEEYGHPFKETGPIIDREFVDYKSYYKECIPQE